VSVHKKIFGKSAQEAHLRFLVATVGPPEATKEQGGIYESLELSLPCVRILAEAVSKP